MGQLKVLVTGAAGFIGSSVVKKLTHQGCIVFGVDNLNDYYDPNLKANRVEHVFGEFKSSRFIKQDLTDAQLLHELFEKEAFDYVIHLAAQAGVRYSIENPNAYLSSNLVAFLNILEACRQYPVKHLLYASSSSVYGGSKAIPFSLKTPTHCPISFYAATKASNELMAHSYSHLYQIPCTGLRFFTAYGPWGRPDMAIFIFTRSLLNNEPMSLFNQGKHRRDFTYIDDVVEAIRRLLVIPPNVKNSQSQTHAPWRVLNIGRGQSVDLMEMVALLEERLGKKARYELKPMQKGDIYENLANIDELKALTGYSPTVDLRTGLYRFVDWYQSYYNV